MSGALAATLAAIRSPGAIAAITAGAAVAGALVGGAVTGLASYKIEGQRQDFENARLKRAERREREREAALLRGAALVWQDQLMRVATAIETTLRMGWWPETYRVADQPLVSLADQKLVGGAASDEEWTDIRIALHSAETVFGTRTQRRSGVPDDVAGPPIPSGEAGEWRELQSQIKAGAEVLGAIGGRIRDVDADVKAG
jgi:hypothetical protein